MKKILSIILCITLILSLAGCANSIEEDIYKSGDVVFESEDLKVILLIKVGVLGHKLSGRVEVLTDDFDGDAIMLVGDSQNLTKTHTIQCGALEKGESVDLKIDYFDSDEELQTWLSSATITAEICNYEERNDGKIFGNTSPSISEEFISDDIKFTFTSAHADYALNTISDVKNPFDFSLRMEYIGDEDSITVTGGMSICCINLYDSNGDVVGIQSDIPLALEYHTFNKGIAKTQSNTCPITNDGKVYELPEIGEYTAIAYIYYDAPDGTAVKQYIELPITVS